MYTYEEQCMMDLSDNYTLLYSFMGRELIDTFGLEGEGHLEKEPDGMAGIEESIQEKGI